MSYTITTSTGTSYTIEDGTINNAFSLKLVGKNNLEAAKKIGSVIAERAKVVGVRDVYFDRGGFLFHGKVKALAEAAREGGLKF